MAVKALATTYFTGELSIPNVSGSTYAEVENLAVLNAMIKKHESKFIHSLLGDNLYALYAAAIALSPSSGIYFDLNAQIYDESGGLYLSPAANYVYFMFWRYNQTVTLQTGEANAKLENSDVVSMNGKLISAWNEMSDKSDVIRKWIRDHVTDYPTYTYEGQEDFSPITVYF